LIIAKKGEDGMGRKMFSFLLSLIFVCSIIPLCFAQEASPVSNEEIISLKTQQQQLQKRIEQLEQEQAKQKEELEKQKNDSSKKNESKCDVSTACSKLKIKGRIVSGYFNSGRDASYPAGSFEIPDAKIQFSFQPDEINTVVARFSLNNGINAAPTATSPLTDYLYLQSKDFFPFLKDTPFSLSSRIGRIKLPFGEEQFHDNAVEGILAATSIIKISPKDEGVALFGQVKLDDIGLQPLGWELATTNGKSGVATDNNVAKTFFAKLFYTPVNPVYLSVSYFDSGRLNNEDTDFTIADLKTRPLGAINWQRKVWGADARYDIGLGKKSKEPIVFCDSKAILNLSSGVFHDIACGAAERAGNFGFIDGIYNLTSKLFTAARYSFVNLDGDVTASLGGVNANKAERYTLGLGYHWTENVQLKFCYDWNKESGPGVEDANNDLLTAVVAAQF